MKCIVVRGRRQVRERGGNSSIDSSPSYPYCLWAHVGWTCWTPTERPAVKDKDRKRDSCKGGYFSCRRHRQWRHQTDKDRASLSPMLAWIWVLETGCYSLSVHTCMTHVHTNNDTLSCSQTSVTSLLSEFTRNQLRLSKKEETYPPPLWPSSDFISTFPQLFIPCVVSSFYCPAMTSSALLFCAHVYLNAQFHSSPGQRGDRRCYFLLLTVPSPLALLILSLFCSLATLTHNNKIPSAAISHQLHAWGAA